MKKFTSILTMALIALMSFTLTSCDEDAGIADTLEGTWRGNMYVEYDDRDAVYSVIQFDRNVDDWYSGTGYWVDYYSNNYWGGNNYIANRIRWTVRDRNIYISLLDERTDVVIYDYKLNNYRFSGYVETPSGKRAYFEMKSDKTNYNWRDNSWDWGYNKVDSTTGFTHLPSSRGVEGKDTATAEKPVRKFVVKE